MRLEPNTKTVIGRRGEARVPSGITSCLSVVLLTAVLLVTLACDPRQFPKTRQAATTATMAVGEVVRDAVQEAKPLATRAIEKGQELYSQGKSAVGSAATRAAAAADQRLQNVRIAATRATAHARSVATRAVSAATQSVPRAITPP